MATVDILIVVDVLGANTSGQGGLANNVWMLDTGKYLGTQEAGKELKTILNAGDEVTWTVTAIDPGTNVAFATTTAPFTSNQGIVPSIINPKQNPVMTQQYLARFSPPGGTPANTTYQYSVVLSMNGQNQTFDPFLKLFSPT